MIKLSNVLLTSQCDAHSLKRVNSIVRASSEEKINYLLRRAK